MTKDYIYYRKSKVKKKEDYKDIIEGKVNMMNKLTDKDKKNLKYLWNCFQDFIHSKPKLKKSIQILGVTWTIYKIVSVSDFTLETLFSIEIIDLVSAILM